MTFWKIPPAFFITTASLFSASFTSRWLELLGECIGKEQIDHPDAKPSLVEAQARRHLQPTRKVLREKQDMLIQQERDKRRAQRDTAAIQAYVAASQDGQALTTPPSGLAA